MTSGSRPALVIFDCDGVLVDSERLSIRVDVDYLARLGWPLTEAEVVERFVGRTDAAMKAIIEEHLGKPIPPDVDEWFARTYRETFERELTAVDGVRDVLDALATAEIPTCVASSGLPDKIRRSLALTDMTEYFGERIFSAVDVEHGKPAPDLFLFAARSMGADPPACAVIEDSVYGVMAATAAGMQTFAYAGGVTSGERLREAAPDAVVFERMDQLPELLGIARRPDPSDIERRPTSPGSVPMRRNRTPRSADQTRR